MSRMLRPVAVMVFAGAATVVAGLQVTSSAAPVPFELHPVHDADSYDHGLGFSDYDISRLKILEPTMYHVEESYVEPGRIDWERMFEEGMQAVEHKVPGFLFHRDVDAGRVALEIGSYRSVLEIPRIGSSRDLQHRLRVIVGLMKLHLDEADIPTDFPPSDHAPTPFAEVEYALINGILSTLDPHTMLLPPPDANEMDVENQGEFGGLGITVVERDGRLVVEHPTPGSPAAEAGIHPEDVILRIDDQSTLNMGLDEAIDLLRGYVDTPVSLQIMRDGFDEPAVMQMKRQVIQLHEVKGLLLDGDVGLISIQSFHKRVEQELHGVLARLNRESSTGLKGVVLDLRDNPGGYLNQAVGVADAFLSTGDIVSTVDGYGRRRDIERAHNDERTEAFYPLVVLTNSNSASASEVVAGALRNNERAVIIGERSFGKGSVQSLHKFYDESKLKLTISKYLTPGDRSIQALGIPADIAVHPVRVGRTDADDGLVARMYWRERVRREVDLDQSLERIALTDDVSAYEFSYLDVPSEAEPYVLDPTDYQVRFARDVILDATSSRRADILANAARIVQTYRRQGEAAILGALRKEGIDWSRGPAYHGSVLPVTVRLEVKETLAAGVRQQLTLHLTNTTDSPLYQVGVMAEEHDVLAGREFLFGRIDPGKTATASVSVHLVDGYPSTQQPMRLSIRDAGTEPLGSTQVELEVQGRALPSFAWTWHVLDADRSLELGEQVKIQLDIKNRGAGATGAAYALLHNRSGKALDIVAGRLFPGELRTIDGKRCKEESAPAGCQLRMLPGEHWTGTFIVELRALADPWELELTLGDDEAYDHASVVGAGRYQNFEHRETLHLSNTGSFGPTHREPPRIVISRAPGSVETADRAVISGLVSDDTGLRHVLVFAGDDKLFAQGAAEGLRSIPFTADAPLKDGVNILTVVAEDITGFSTTQSVVTYRREPEQLTQAATPAAD